MYKLIDSSKTSPLNDLLIRDLILSPVRHSLLFRCKEYHYYSMMFLGFYFEIFTPPISNIYENNKYQINFNNKSYLSHYKELKSIPEFIQVVGMNIEKEEKGLSRISC